MKFEKILLDDYLQTKDGKRVYSFFSNFKDIYLNDRPRFFQFVNSLLEIDLAEDYFQFCWPNGEEIVMTVKDWEVDKRIKSFENFIKIKTEHFKENFEFYSYCRAWIPFFSLLNFLKYPDYCFPYLFHSHFYKFADICDLFDITIPPLPGKIKHFERSYYYFELCKVMHDFRIQHNLSPTELNVFLYGFAPRFFSKFIENELPEPNRIFILGASQEDAEHTLNHKIGKNDVYLWQGCSEIMTGDIILLYERAPYKRFGSIWRAVSPSFDDPFHGYPGKVFVSYAIQNIPEVTYDDLCKDKIWSKNKLIRCNMQGIGFKNTAITIEEYDALKKLFKKKKKTFDSGILPEPPPYTQFYNDDLNDEEDVERKLLEPFLEKIGYNIEKEISRQFPIRMGRGHYYYPDYALHAKKTNGFESAEFILEAKYRIPTKKQLMKDFGQAKSYAIRLSCKGFALVSMEGIWISWEDQHFSLENIEKYSWQELKDPNVLGKLKKRFHSICKPKK